jgi:glycosyltransferase involved in cell wall biosynthesis
MNYVMQLIQHPYIGGLEKMAFSLCKKQVENTKMCLVALESTNRSALKKWPELLQLEHFFCLNKPERFSFEAVDKLVELIDKFHINTIHSHHIGPLLYASLAKLRRPHIKHIHTIHDAWYLSKFKYRVLTQLIRLFTPVIMVADAKAVADVVYQHASVSSDHIIYNGIDTDYFTPIAQQTARRALNLPLNKTLIGCAARVESGKGHRAMLRSLKNLPDNVEMVFAGSGSQLSTYQAYAADLSVTERVHWLGCVEQMPAFYSALDAFCLFSKREGLPLSILEAMSCNCPVVASDVGAIKEVLNEHFGAVIPIEQEHLLAQSLLKSVDLKHTKDIRRHAIEIGNLSVMSEHYDKIYQSVTV